MDRTPKASQMNLAEAQSLKSPITNTIYDPVPRPSTAATQDYEPSSRNESRATNSSLDEGSMLGSRILTIENGYQSSAGSRTGSRNASPNGMDTLARVRALQASRANTPNDSDIGSRQGSRLRNHLDPTDSYDQQQLLPSVNTHPPKIPRTKDVGGSSNDLIAFLESVPPPQPSRPWTASPANDDMSETSSHLDSYPKKSVDSYSFRPSTSDLFRSLKPKVKLFPRPVTDENAVKPKSSGGFRQKLPQGMRSRAKKTEDRPKSSKSHKSQITLDQRQYETRSQHFISPKPDNSQFSPPPPVPPMPQQIQPISHAPAPPQLLSPIVPSTPAPIVLPTIRSPTVPARSAPIPSPLLLQNKALPRAPTLTVPKSPRIPSTPSSPALSTYLTPEKQRLMKALQLRKKQREEATAAEERAQNSSHVITNGFTTIQKDSDVATKPDSGVDFESQISSDVAPLGLTVQGLGITSPSREHMDPLRSHLINVEKLSSSPDSHAINLDQPATISRSHFITSDKPPSSSHSHSTNVDKPPPSSHSQVKALPDSAPLEDFANFKELPPLKDFTPAGKTPEITDKPPRTPHIYELAKSSFPFDQRPPIPAKQRSAQSQERTPFGGSHRNVDKNSRRSRSRRTLSPGQLSPNFDDYSDEEFFNELETAEVQEAHSVTVAQSTKNEILPVLHHRVESNNTSSVSSFMHHPPRTDSRGPASRIAMNDSPISPKPLSLSRDASPNPMIVARKPVGEDRSGVNRKINVSSGISRRIQTLADNSRKELAAANSLEPTRRDMTQTHVDNSTMSTSVERTSNSLFSMTPFGGVRRPSLSGGHGRPGSSTKTVAPSVSRKVSFDVQRPGSSHTTSKNSHAKRDSLSVTAHIVRGGDSQQYWKRTPVEEEMLDLSGQSAQTRRPGMLHRSSTSKSSFSRSERAPSIAVSSRPGSRDSNMSSMTRQSIETVRGMRHRNEMKSRGMVSLSEQSLERVDEHSESGKSSRASKLLKRMSGISRKVSDEVRPGSSGLTRSFSRSKRQARENYAPKGMVVGDLNVQFPDTLLWKRRWVEIDSFGNVVLSPAREEERSRGVKRKFHLSEFRQPIMPPQHRQELPHSKGLIR